jgi:hypothetical protein
MMDYAHTFAAYLFSSWYGLQSWRGESAFVAKRPRELISHPHNSIRNFFVVG